MGSVCHVFTFFVKTKEQYNDESCELVDKKSLCSLNFRVNSPENFFFICLYDGRER